MKIKYAIVSTNSSFDGSNQIDYTYARFDGLLEAEVWLSDAMEASVELNSLKCSWYRVSGKDTQKLLEIETKLRQQTGAYEKKFGYDLLDQDTEFRIVKVYTFN